MSELAQKLKSLTVLQIGVVLLVAGVIIGFLDFSAKGWHLGSLIKDYSANASTELISIAVTVLIIDRLYQRRQTEQEKEQRIKRYREELGDYLGWQSEEATYRIVGLIRRLNQEGVAEINLRRAYLKAAELDGVNLGGAYLMRANLKGVNLYKANLRRAQMHAVNLEGADLREANLEEADLYEANIKGAYLVGANVKLAVLELADLEGGLTSDGRVVVRREDTTDEEE